MIDRRELLCAAAAAGTALLAARPERAQAIMGAATRGMATPRFADIAVINTAPEGPRLCVVKVTTDQPGLTATAAPPSPGAPT